MDTRRAEGNRFREETNRGNRENANRRKGREGVAQKARHFHGVRESEKGMDNGMGNATVIICLNVCIYVPWSV